MVELGINLEVDQEKLKVRLCLLTVEDKAKINPETWYSPGLVGKLNIKPISISIKDPDQPIRIKQYPIPREGREGLQPIIERLLAQGLLAHIAHKEAGWVLSLSSYKQTYHYPVSCGS